MSEPHHHQRAKSAPILARRTLLSAGAAGVILGGLPFPVLAMTEQPQPLIRPIPTPSGRAVELWHWPAQGEPRGHILFSHGASSAPRHYQRLCGAWAAAGFTVDAPLHVDSADHPRRADYAGLSGWSARIEDMRAAALALGDAPFIAAGHSYGGLTAMALGGGVSLVPAGIDGPLRHAQVMAVAAFSPPPAIAALVGDAGYAPLAVPSFHQSGTRDVLGPNPKADDWMGHLDAFHAAPADDRHYALVLDSVDHYFGGLICKPDAPGPAMPAALDEAVHRSIQFMQAATGLAEAQQALTAALTHQGLIGLRRR